MTAHVAAQAVRLRAGGVAAFGIGMIIWFTWLGLHVLVQRTSGGSVRSENVRATSIN